VQAFIEKLLIMILTQNYLLLIKEAKKRQIPVISGTFILSNPSIPISAAIWLQDFDRDMRSEQLLGEVMVAKPLSSTAPVFYSLTYDESGFCHDYKRTFLG